MSFSAIRSRFGKGGTGLSPMAMSLKEGLGVSSTIGCIEGFAAPSDGFPDDD